MPSDKPVIAVRTTSKIIQKLKVVSSKNSRSMSGEVEQLIKQHIEEYEKNHGEIKIEEQ